MTQVAPRLRKWWEQRLPGLPTPWTHWRLEGDGTLIALVAGDNLGEAVQRVAENAQRLSNIYASRARVDSAGQCVEIEKHRVQIANAFDDRRMVEKFGPE